MAAGDRVELAFDEGRGSYNMEVCLVFQFTHDEPPNDLAIVVGRVQISSFSPLHAILEAMAGPFSWH
jgi:hypothetical protein